MSEAQQACDVTGAVILLKGEVIGAVNGSSALACSKGIQPWTNLSAILKHKKGKNSINRQDPHRLSPASIEVATSNKGPQ